MRVSAMDRHRTETNHVSVHKPTTVPQRPGSGRVPFTPTPGRVPRSSAAWRSSSGPSSWTSWWLTTCKCLATNQRVSFPSIISRESGASEAEKRVCQPQTDVLSKTLAVLPDAETQMVQKVPLLLFFARSSQTLDLPTAESEDLVVCMVVVFSEAKTPVLD